MKRETARRIIDDLDYYLQHHTDDYSESDHEAMMIAIKALEQESAIDKIRAEIEDIDTPNYDFEGFYKCQSEVLQILDKYKAESEDKE